MWKKAERKACREKEGEGSCREQEGEEFTFKEAFRQPKAERCKEAEAGIPAYTSWVHTPMLITPMVHAHFYLSTCSCTVLVVSRTLICVQVCHSLSLPLFLSLFLSFDLIDQATIPMKAATARTPMKAARTTRNLPPEEWGLTPEATLRKMKNAGSKVYHATLTRLLNEGHVEAAAKEEAQLAMQATKLATELPPSMISR